MYSFPCYEVKTIYVKLALVVLDTYSCIHAHAGANIRFDPSMNSTFNLSLKKFKTIITLRVKQICGIFRDECARENLI